jgi:hypothetical protein
VAVVVGAAVVVVVVVSFDPPPQAATTSKTGMKAAILGVIFTAAMLLRGIR